MYSFYTFIHLFIYTVSSSVNIILSIYKHYDARKDNAHENLLQLLGFIWICILHLNLQSAFCLLVCIVTTKKFLKENLKDPFKQTVIWSLSPQRYGIVQIKGQEESGKKKTKQNLVTEQSHNCIQIFKRSCKWLDPWADCWHTLFDQNSVCKANRIQMHLYWP